MPNFRRPGRQRYQGVLATMLVAGATAGLFAIPVGSWGGASASASYYYYNPGGGPAVLTLAPPAATNPVGTVHTVTATLTQDGNPVGGVLVSFAVTGSTSIAGSCTTDSSGMCTFSYTGPALPGADLITAYADLNGNGVRDAEEPTATASKAWTTPTSTPGQITGGGQILAGGDAITFGFNAKSTSSRINGECTVVDHDTRRMIKCVDATVVAQTGNTASIFGHATDNGVATNYVIKVADNGEPGRGVDTFSIQTGSGYTASGTLTSGNVQVH